MLLATSGAESESKTRPAPARSVQGRVLGLGVLAFTTTMMDSPRVGARIKYSGFNGTIRYVGPVETANGTWLGVEWDDPRRGKHDGSKDGRRYFSCRYVDLPLRRFALS